MKSTRPLHVALALGACVVFPSLRGDAQVRVEPGDAGIHTAVLGHVARQAEGTLLVDSRTLLHGADLVALEPGDLGPEAPEILRVAQALGYGTTDILRDRGCLFARGLPHPPEQQERLAPAETPTRAACRARAPFTSVAVGLPVAEEGSRVPTVRVRAVQVGTSRYAAHEYTLSRGPSGEWEITAVESIMDVMS